MSTKNIVMLVVAVLLVWAGVHFFTSGGSTTTNTNEPGNYSFPVSGQNPTPAPTPTPVVHVSPQPVATPTPAVSATIPLPARYDIAIQNFTFSQKKLTIKKDDTVYWTNKDSPPHTITGDNNVGPQSGTLNINQDYHFKFTKVGTYTYHCNFHPSMTGTIVVTN